MEYRIKIHLFTQIGIVLVTTGVVLIGGFSMSSVFGQASNSMDNFKTEFESRAVPYAEASKSYLVVLRILDSKKLPVRLVRFLN